MNNILKSMAILGSVVAMSSCAEQKENRDGFEWIIDKFDDVKILRYQVPGFEKLPLNDKIFIYYLQESAAYGRDILFDQNFKYNLAVRRTLEAMYTSYQGDKQSTEWLEFEKYLKKMWFSNGIHHHYSNDKFTPEFSEKFFDTLVTEISSEKLPQDFGTQEELLSCVKEVIFNPTKYAKRSTQNEGVDMLTSSSNNYYSGVTQSEAEAFYNKMADSNDDTPISYGLNSQLTKIDGKLTERVWKLDGMYSKAIEPIIYWLDKATSVANAKQQEQIEKLVSFYKSGDLKEFDEFNILWVEDTDSRVDFVNGFTEVYGDPLGHKASWESIVNFRDDEATKRTKIISDNAQWFEDNSPIDEQFKKSKVKGVSAKVITVAMLAGDCYPATPIGINLPNADWIRRDHGSKSVTIENITAAYSQASKGDGFAEEFILHQEDRDRIEKYGVDADNLHIDLHECLGHGSGKLALGIKGDELKQYGSALEETRADLFALYYLADPQMEDLGLIPSPDMYKAEYYKYIMNGMMTQLTRIKLGSNVEQAHMRNRKLISEWCFEKGAKDNIIEMVVENGKRYMAINDFDGLRQLFGDLLREIQRIKSEGDFEAGKKLIETYAVEIDYDLHKEVLDRYAALNLEPYSGFVNPTYELVIEGDEIIDVAINYEQGYTEQMLEYANNYSTLPTKN